MYKLKPHQRVLQEKELLDKFARIHNVGPQITFTPIVDKIPNKKRVRQLEDRYTQIEKDNRHLLERIMNIMSTSTSRCNTATTRRRSLNEHARKQQDQTIARENRMLLQKLTCRKSEYSKDTMDRQWSQIKQYQHNLSYSRPQNTQQKRMGNQSFAF